MRRLGILAIVLGGFACSGAPNQLYPPLNGSGKADDSDGVVPFQRIWVGDPGGAQFHWQRSFEFPEGGRIVLVFATARPLVANCKMTETNDVSGYWYDGWVSPYGPRTVTDWTQSLGWVRATPYQTSPYVTTAWLGTPGDYALDVGSNDGSPGFTLECWFTQVRNGFACTMADGFTPATYKGYFNDGALQSCNGQVCDPVYCGSHGRGCCNYR
jgi:hypothetical protein